MLLVAGMVVFVNKVEDYKDQARVAKADAAASVIAIGKERDFARTAQTLAERSALEAETRYLSVNSTLATAQEDKKRLANDVEQQKLLVEKADVRTQTALAAVGIAQQAQKTAEEALLKVRGESDTIQKEYNQAMVALSDLTNRLDVLGKRYEKSKEDVVALQTEIERINKENASRPTARRPCARPCSRASPPSRAPRASRPASPARRRRQRPRARWPARTRTSAASSAR